MLPLGGHTPGQLAVIVETGAERIVLASDAIHFYEELRHDWPYSILANLEETYQALETLRELDATEGVRVIPGHDPIDFLQHPQVRAEGEPFAVRLAVPSGIPVA